jgi:Fe-S oxidoreductase
VLQHAGFDVVLPDRRLCCGRPLYDFGFLDAARQRLTHVMSELIDRLDVGGHGPVAVVGLEPGCMSVFKDELLKLFPDDPRAKRLSTLSTLLGDFLHGQGYQPPTHAVGVTIHTHCHQRSLFNSGADQALLSRMGATCTVLDSGCCGMAGSFGFHPDHVALSKDIAELSLFPSLRQKPADNIVVTNGFSCREQIRQGLGVESQHLAQLLRSAICHSSTSRSIAPRSTTQGDSV